MKDSSAPPESNALRERERHLLEALEESRRPGRDAVRAVADLLRACARSARDRSTSAVACEVQALLLGRCADSLDGVVVLAGVGNELGALALSGTAYELGHLAAFIASDESRALRWRGWKKAERMPWRVREISDGALRQIGRADPSDHDRQYVFYSIACLAKHGSPFAMVKVAAPLSEEEWVVEADLAPGRIAGKLSYDAFMIAGSSGLVAVHSFATHYSNMGTAEIGDLLDAVLDRWNPFAAGWDQYRRRSKRQGASE